MNTSAEGAERRTQHGNAIPVELLRGFLRRALSDDAIADRLNEVLFEHVVEGRYHPSVVAASLPAYIEELLECTTEEDWRAVADDLIADARRADGEV